jgi:hypothetical protein
VQNQDKNNPLSVNQPSPANSFALHPPEQGQYIKGGTGNMSMDKYNAMKKPPAWALREIRGGRLAGKTDINPQWRIQAMTEQYGPCGTGWKWEIVKLWNETAPAGEVMAFAQISLYTKDNDTWSAPVPGIGGSMLSVMEKAGMHNSDEGYKMAVTDALSVAFKFLGVAADIYSGHFDGKYGLLYDNIGTNAVQPASATRETKPPEGGNLFFEGTLAGVDGKEGKIGPYWVISVADNKGVTEKYTIFKSSTAENLGNVIGDKIRVYYKPEGKYKNFVSFSPIMENENG